MIWSLSFPVRRFFIAILVSYCLQIKILLIYLGTCLVSKLPYAGILPACRGFVVELSEMFSEIYIVSLKLICKFIYMVKKIYAY